MTKRLALAAAPGRDRTDHLRPSRADPHDLALADVDQSASWQQVAMRAKS